MPTVEFEDFSSVFNVKEYGVVGDGVTDDTAAMEIAIEAAAAAGGSAFVPAGVYLINNLAPNSSINLWAKEGTVTFIYNIGNRCIYVQNDVNAGASQAISAASNQVINSDAAVTRLTVSNASAFAKGDVVHLHSQNLFRTGGEYIGGSSKVHSVDTVNNYVYLTDALWYLSEFTTSPLIRKYDRTKTFMISGINFEANGNPYDDTTTTARYSAVEIIAVPYATVQNCGAKSLWRDFVLLRSSPYSIVRDCRAERLVDFVDGSGALVPGYFATSYAADRNTLIMGNYVQEVRHGYTNGSQEGYAYNPNNWMLYGIPAYDDIRDNTFDSCLSAAIDTHEPGWGISIRGNTITNSKRGYADGTGGGNGIAIRAANVLIEGNVIEDCADGIYYVPVDVGRKAKITVKNNTVRRSLTTSSNATCINLSAVDGITAANRPEFFIVENTFENTERGIMIGNAHFPKSQGNTFIGCDRLFDVGIGSSVVSVNDFADFSNSLQTAPYNVMFMRGSAAGVSNAALINFTFIKGPTSNTPAELFSTNVDSGGTYNYYYARNVTQINPSGTTSTVVTEAASTTLAAWTAGAAIV